MIKLIFIFIALVVTGYTAAFLKDEPGQIIIEWYGWFIESSVAAIILIIFTTIIVVFYIFRLLYSLVKMPKNFKKKVIESRNKRGMSALYSGLSAVAMNEKDLAEFYYKKTKNLIKESPLKLLLEREIVRKEDKESTQIAVLEKMLIHPETKLLALKNWIDYSIKKDDKEKAFKLAKLIPREKDTPKWFFEKIILLRVYENNWQDIFKIIKLMYKYKKMNNREKTDLLGKIHYAKALHDQSKGNINAALKSISLSFRYSPEFSPAIATKASLLFIKNKNKGLKYAENLWRKTPSPDLLNFFLKIYKNYTPLKMLNYINGISIQNKNNNYSNYAICHLAIKAHAWSKAKSYLEKISKNNWTKNMYIMMSEIDEMGHGNLKMSKFWVEQSKSAKMDSNWGCMSCSYVSETWNLICPKCYNINKMKWDKFFVNKAQTISKRSKTDSSKNLKEIIHKQSPENAARGILNELRDGIER